MAGDAPPPAPLATNTTVLLPSGNAVRVADIDQTRPYKLMVAAAAAATKKPKAQSKQTSESGTNVLPGDVQDVPAIPTEAAATPLQSPIELPQVSAAIAQSCAPWLLRVTALVAAAMLGSCTNGLL
jgi:hypothetical protein